MMKRARVVCFAAVLDLLSLLLPLMLQASLFLVVEANFGLVKKIELMRSSWVRRSEIVLSLIYCSYKVERKVTGEL